MRDVLLAVATLGLSTGAAEIPARPAGGTGSLRTNYESTGSGSRARPLEGRALRALLSDAFVAPVQAGGITTSHPPGEMFRADGSYIRIVGRTRLFGRFAIHGALVCVRAEAVEPLHQGRPLAEPGQHRLSGFPRLCRRVVPRGEGIYAFVNRDGTATPMTVRPNP
jgi:hypothetical protein